LKTITLVISFVLLFCIARGVDYVTFDPSSTSNVVYRLRIRAETNSQSYTVMELGTNRFVGLTNGPWGRQYYTAVAVTTNGWESDPSNEVLSTNRPGAPVNLKLELGTNAAIIQGTINGGSQWRHLATVIEDPVLLAQQRSQMLRAFSTNLPPLPGGSR